MPSLGTTHVDLSSIAICAARVLIGDDETGHHET